MRWVAVVMALAVGCVAALTIHNLFDGIIVTLLKI